MSTCHTMYTRVMQRTRACNARRTWSGGAKDFPKRYSSLFKLRLSNYYQLQPDAQTDANSLLFSAAYGRGTDTRVPN